MEKEKKKSGTANWNTRTYIDLHTCSHKQQNRHWRIINSYSVYVSFETEGFIFSHLDREICVGDESHHQWHLFHKVPVLLGIPARVTGV